MWLCCGGVELGIWGFGGFRLGEEVIVGKYICFRGVGRRGVLFREDWFWFSGLVSVVA